MSSPAIATPTPIPAFAPVPRLEDLGAGLMIGFVVGEDVGEDAGAGLMIEFVVGEDVGEDVDVCGDVDVELEVPTTMMAVSVVIAFCVVDTLEVG